MVGGHEAQLHKQDLPRIGKWSWGFMSIIFYKMIFLSV